jgi:hypothetical protein
MNKRQRKKNMKRELERLTVFLEESQRHLVHFWCTHIAQDERERALIQYNLHTLNYHDAQERQERLEKGRMRARGKVWKYRHRKEKAERN